ncbi:hypothetical protein R1sor_000495 [Riccia sorocarpa]|uniref:F-box associated domain-containing protein n=1 Tax=Riccia sorocarpa TaxID=122646 RepID=A0ABD3GTA2_9MARC
MDPEVWKHLTDHEDILRLVLVRVSWDTNLRLRPVSKAWNNTLLELSKFLTWSSMLTDRSFYLDYPELEWVDSSTNIESNITIDVHSCSSKPQEQSLATGDSICILSATTCAVVNFRINRWCKIPPIKQLPFGQWNEFSVTRSAKGLLLLERKHVPDGNENLYLHELDRFLFNPLTQDFSKLPPVPRDPQEIDCSLEYPMIITVDNDRVIRVVAVELGKEVLFERWWKTIRILIWQENGSGGWEAANLNGPSSRYSLDVEELRDGVFAAGKLFLNTKCRNPQLGNRKGGYRIMECNWETHSVLIGGFNPSPIQHLFQHQGVLMRLTGTWKEDPHAYFQQPQSLKLCTFDHLNGTWLQESTMEMPEQMVNRFYDTLSDERNTFVHVEGDILCIGNCFSGDVLFLYNLLSRSWTEVCAKYVMDKDENNPNRRISLWSPKANKREARSFPAAKRDCLSA